MPAPLQTQVLIIGAGPTGMVAALCLSRHGISSIVLERHGGLQTHPKAHEVSGRTLEILAPLGVGLDELRAEASPDEDASRIVFCETLDRELGRIDLKADGGADKYRRHVASAVPYLNLSQVEVERILARHVLAAEGIDLRHGHQWNSFVQSDEGVVSQVTDLKSGESLEIRSRYVICADGAGSRSRAALGIDLIGPDKLQDFVNAYFEADLSHLVRTRGKLYFVYNPEAPGALIAHHIHRRWVFHTFVYTPYERVEDFTTEVVRDRILAALGRPSIDIQIKSMSQWRMTAQVARRFRSGRVFLAGDAAHRFPPSGGLGMNSGVADAHNLAWKLASVLHGRAPESLLDSYELERRPIVQTMCDESRNNFERMNEVLEALGVGANDMEDVARWLSRWPIGALPASVRSRIRSAVLRVGSKVLARKSRRPEVQAQLREAIDRQKPHFDRLGLDLGLHYPCGALIPDGSPAVRVDDPVRTYVPSTRPGARFPHFWLDGDAARRSSHALLDPTRFTLLLGTECVVPASEQAGLDEVSTRYGVRVETLGGTSTAHGLAQIDLDGALLIRPDGFVAWRQARGVRPGGALLARILEELFRVTRPAPEPSPAAPA